MGLFDKKYCDVCGEKIGLLGNRKLEDGNLCKDCARKLSPWFSERRNSSVNEIKRQLEYREENRGRVARQRHKAFAGRGRGTVHGHKREEYRGGKPGRAGAVGRYRLHSGR